MASKHLCIRCGSRCSLFWWSLAIGGEDHGELCDTCMIRLNDFLEAYK